MSTGEEPGPLKSKVRLEVGEEVELEDDNRQPTRTSRERLQSSKLRKTHRGHGSSTEEVLLHPPVAGFEIVRRGCVAEDVNEKKRLSRGRLLLGSKPGRDSLQDLVVGLEVLEHFYRHDSVEPSWKIVERRSALRRKDASSRSEKQNRSKGH